MIEAFTGDFDPFCYGLVFIRGNVFALEIKELDLKLRKYIIHYQLYPQIVKSELKAMVGKLIYGVNYQKLSKAWRTLNKLPST